MIVRNFKITDLERNKAYRDLPLLNQKILNDSSIGINKIAYTLEHNGEIIGSAGVIECWPGVVAGWALISDLVFKYPIAVHKAVKVIIPELEEKHKIRRLQTVCLKIKSHAKWLESLGFVFEGEMKNYGMNGETYLRYARIR